MFGGLWLQDPAVWCWPVGRWSWFLAQQAFGCGHPGAGVSSLLGMASAQGIWGLVSTGTWAEPGPGVTGWRDLGVTKLVLASGGWGCGLPTGGGEVDAWVSGFCNR